MAKTDAARWQVKPGTKVNLTEIDTRSTDGAPGDKAKTEAVSDGELEEELHGLQERLYAEGERSLLVVLQAIDAGGKDGTIKHVFGGLNPASCRVVSFKVPSEEERSHDFLWRVHAKAPAKGEVVVFNRSHYEDVLVVRVHSLVPEDVWRPRYDLINDFEANLAAAGTRIVKLYLHISKEEQAERFQARLDDPSKRWKFRKGDLAERERWDDYRAAFEEAISRTSTDAAPWYVVPADRKWYRNWAVSRILCETLTDMDPQYPPAEEDLAGVVVT
jgi:PPK2 family polyphosphate:nucleotide phosphotransferase